MRRTGRPEQWTARHEAESLRSRERLPTDTERKQSRRRKLRVVAAVRGGLLSLNQALQRFNLTLDEFYEWERDVGEELARRREQARPANTGHMKLTEENRVLRAENRRLREQVNSLRTGQSDSSKKARRRSRGDVDRSPE